MVFDQLTETIEKTGIPREIVGDQGSDIKKGIEKFCAEHSETSYVYDIKHKIALIICWEFEQDDVWQEFVQLCSQTRQKIQQTHASFSESKKSAFQGSLYELRAGDKMGCKRTCFSRGAI